MFGRLIAGLFALLMLVALVLLVLAGLLVRTLPPASERHEVAGLERPASLEFDSAGVPTLRAETLPDLAFLSGWAHARDRRFQMELQRRSAAGRLSEVVGPVALAADRRMRTFGFAVVADSAAAGLGTERRRTFAAYAAGVNAYDRSHPAPPEFAVLRLPREPWRVEDCLLTVLVMFEQLNDDGSSERMVERMDAELATPLVEFLLPDSTPGDVPLAGGRAPAPPALPDVALRPDLGAAIAPMIPKPRSPRSSARTCGRAAATTGRSGRPAPSPAVRCWPAIRIWACACR